jgi:DNA-binding SARP family transcriptional activator
MDAPDRYGSVMGEFRLLGHVEALVDGRPIEVGHARQRCVLAILLLDANRPVPVDVLADRLWADRQPQRARNALAGYVSRLRGLFDGSGAATFDRRGDGYAVTVDPETVDVHRFRRLVAEARGAAADETTDGLLDQALRLWRGDSFATLDTPWLNAIRAALEAERFGATLDHNDVALRLGRHGELVARLLEIAEEHPLDERLARQLMLALYRCGRQADALHHYERVRARLADELGTDPGSDLRDLYLRILNGDLPAVARAWSEPAAPDPVPRQLPAPSRIFTGRARELDRLSGILAGAGDPPASVPIATISGMPGIGKTTLAVRWAYQIAHRFPDGQLFIDLCGFDAGGQPKSSGEALQAFLDAFAVPAFRIPSDLEGRAALYRSLLADRRLLIVLDNARNAEQIRPLLPGAPGCFVVVTSRNQLTGLIASDGAYPVVLDVLGRDDARGLLADHVGADRIADEPESAAEIVTLCAGLPLALATVAARAAIKPTFPLAAVAKELGETRHTLDAFTGPGHDPATDVRAALSWSYHALGDPAARLFRLLGVHPGPDIGHPAAATLAGLAPAQVRPLLAELAHAHLVTEHRHGRYAMHDLVRAYAAERADTHVDERVSAVRRMLDHYLRTAYDADRLLTPYREDLLALDRSAIPATGEGIGDGVAAVAWFKRERPVLVAVQQLAAAGGHHAHAWQLAWALATFLHREGSWHEQATTQLAALDAVMRGDDGAAQGYARRALAVTYVRLGRHGEGNDLLRRARDVARAVGDRRGEAVALAVLGWALGEQGRVAEALAEARRAYDAFKSLYDRSGQAWALNYIGRHLAQLGEHDRAIATILRASDLHQETGDRHGLADSLDAVAVLHHTVGRHERAIVYFRRCLDLCGDDYHPWGRAALLLDLGDAHDAVGDARAANRARTEAEDVLADLDHTHPAADTLRARLRTVAALRSSASGSHTRRRRAARSART